MRTIDRASRFRRDYKRELKGRYRLAVQTELPAAIVSLAMDQPLPPRLEDHPLSGEWEGYRDCHIKPDLVLVYRKSKPDLLELVRLGTHSELGF